MRKDDSSDYLDRVQTRGLHGLVELQKMFLDDPSLPVLPISPLASASGLPDLLERYVSACTNAPPERHMSLRKAAELLPSCTICTPLEKTETYLLTDLFEDFRDIATTCTSDTQKAGERRATMVDLLGADMAKGIIDFWREEYVDEGPYYPVN